MEKITESASHYRHLEQMSVAELLENINREDQTVPLAVQKALPQIEALVSAIVPKMREGGRLFYIGAGTSGRLGVLDASECPPTFGVPPDMVMGLIAGGPDAIIHASEGAEDRTEAGAGDLRDVNLTSRDVVVGIAVSGRTPYVIGALDYAKSVGAATVALTCRRAPASPRSTPNGSPSTTTASTMLRGPASVPSSPTPNSSS